MRIILANPRGFCAGVNMAIECVDRVLQHQGPPVYVFHEIVHNKHVVGDFISRGVVFVDSIEEVPEGATVVYSAHGVSPEIRAVSKGRNLVEIDATCPLVTKVHHEVKNFARKGYHIIFIGHRNHDEAVGTVGEAPESITVVESVEEVEALAFPQDAKLCYVTQTTLSMWDAQTVMGALKAKYPGIKPPPTDDICYATTNRQNAVNELGGEAQLVLVVGSQNSSNSKRLAEMAQQAGKAAYLIDDQRELEPEWFRGVDTVFITAGASAPERLVQDLVARIQEQFGGDVEERTLVEETMSFELPKPLRRLNVVGSN
ncbi:MAG TPA: 4-hydroxy-3-methylbut-2-enyl diphosphate reductase [Tepidisphaeraceae bacterium]|nr:4-hydroxy-3-methylbut-2-enyl diphosphate reductase [Tepidisphaeraceae bacterium]